MHVSRVNKKLVLSMEKEHITVHVNYSPSQIGVHREREGENTIHIVTDEIGHYERTIQ